ncbi:hypothetical protein INS49_004560 [Diaporthe citri]|uniref:uncharacterized protein n=1 Tax=Diaporthe citri TaxID=83186 RepID=UPI001C7F57D3|nr:uncharacterized protein INS49_004560 [Diaporthe citri]KAG6354543.1 hypothetical protein INS49_004560 [Diaporthe citri]
MTIIRQHLLQVRTIFTSLLSVAAALPSLAAREHETHDLETRDTRILDLTVETWPTESYIYNNQSYAFFTVTPKDDTHYTFGFSNSDPANTGTINVFAVTAEGLETIVERLGSSKSTSRDVKKTNKPFRITIDSNYP